MSLYSIENQQLKFTFDTDDGLMCRSIYHKAGKKEWLKEESPPFESEAECNEEGRGHDLSSSGRSFMGGRT